jgi:hypothetical protein
MPRYNPFRPGHIVTPGMFAGRYQELTVLEKSLFQTKNANPNHFLICGERGIGKSSLLFYLTAVAEGKINPIDGDSFSFLTIQTELEPGLTYSDLIRKIGGEFQRTIAAQNQYKEWAKSAWEFLTRWEVMGVKFNNRTKTTNGDAHQLLDDLVHTVQTTIEAIGGNIDGAAILIDEADKPSPEAGLGEFVKLFTERLTKRGCNTVMLGLAGLPQVIDSLKQSHESSPRIFEMVHLNPLSTDESKYVIHRGLAEIKEKSGVEVTIESVAENAISALSEGYPHFVQQFAYSACDHDKDNKITLDDVVGGTFGKHGALAQLGVKYFHEMYFEQIFSDDYRGVLQFMAGQESQWVSKDDMRKALNIKESTLNNALSALKQRNIIIPQEGRKGIYRLPTASFGVWIRAYAKGAQTVEGASTPTAPTNQSPQANKDTGGGT